jgi:hypothetical protein
VSQQPGPHPRQGFYDAESSAYPTYHPVASFLSLAVVITELPKALAWALDITGTDEDGDGGLSL